MTPVSENTRALLLLTAPLIVGAADGGSTPALSLSEFNKLARRLKEMAVEPIELLGPARAELEQYFHHWYHRSALKACSIAVSR